MVEKFKSWNEKYDLWSLFSDFFFLFGILFLDWSPILLILWFIIDTLVMLGFVWILFHKENNDWIKTFGFGFLAFGIVCFLIAFYNGIIGHITDLETEHMVRSDPSHILNLYILPFALCVMGLNHYAEFQRSLYKMKNGTYKSGFIKRFFMRYLLVCGLVVIIVFSFVYFNIGIIIALIGIKAVLRSMNKKIRKFT